MSNKKLVRITDSEITIFLDVSTLRTALSLGGLKDGVYYENVDIDLDDTKIILNNPTNTLKIHSNRFPTDINKIGTIVNLELSDIDFGKSYSLFNWGKPDATLGKTCVTYCNEIIAEKTIINIGNRKIYFKNLAKG